MRPLKMKRCPICRKLFKPYIGGRGIRTKLEPKGERQRIRFCSIKCANSRGMRRGSRDTHLDAKSKPSRFRIAWASGLYEGEGSVFWERGGLMVHLAQSGDPWIPNKLQTFFGGNVGLYAPSRTSSSKLPVYTWQIT